MNYKGITLTATSAKVYNAMLFKNILKIEKNSSEKSEQILEKSIHNLTDSEYMHKIMRKYYCL